jgi:hypothetical protein
VAAALVHCTPSQEIVLIRFSSKVRAQGANRPEPRTAFADACITIEIDPLVGADEALALLSDVSEVLDHQVRAAVAGMIPPETIIIDWFFRSADDIPLFPAELKGTRFPDIADLDQAALALLPGSEIDGILRDSLGREFRVTISARCQRIASGE